MKKQTTNRVAATKAKASRKVIFRITPQSCRRDLARMAKGEPPLSIPLASSVLDYAARLLGSLIPLMEAPKAPGKDVLELERLFSLEDPR